MVKGYTVPLSPRGDANLASAPPWHYAGDIVAVEFWTDPAAAEATLPDGLSPDLDSSGHVVALFVDWQFSGENEEYLDPVRSQYREFFVLVDAGWKDQPVSWCPYIYVDNDLALARGWVQGFPKKLAAGQYDKPAVHELVMMVSSGQQVADVWAGTGEIELFPARGEELADLAPVRTGAGFRSSMVYTVTEVRELAA
ncbi:acetoacetate decarboxylase family protein [Pseudonocardia xinjiangensis]|uniref:Acetoacetate decarboxylase n=1 Tax=Pseudonocardia xinjiangensis TaxID=75289 RepID=A0ABX1RD66_9PSEU|nr:acetoacetate decarboxylase family protein [Pseudonocardia xinjiangensis]NMH77096.1 hypothetical protein [Pseudonocardia xinjiangensis]